MADNIQDNSPEMALDDPRIAEFVAAGEAGADGVKPEPKQVKPDVKKPAASSVADTAEDDAEETPDQLKAKVKGLQAELGRRKGNSDRVDALQAELREVKDKLAAPATSTKFNWIQKLDDEALANKQVDWDDELADARAKYGRAEEASDEHAMQRQGQRILAAKDTLSAFRREFLDRTRREQAEAHQTQADAQSIHVEIADMRDAVTELMPDLLTQDSAAWIAGNDEYLAHPQLMARLGPLGEVVAAAMAVIRNPELVNKKGAPAARRDVIGSLEKSVKKALSTGVSSQTTTRSTNTDISTPESLASFNAMIDKIKGG